MNKLTSTLTDRYQTTIPREVRSFKQVETLAKKNPEGYIHKQERK